MTTSSGTASSVAISIDDYEIEQFVFILVFDSRFHLVTTDVSKMASQDFFQALKASYNAHRGILRRIFSIFVYSHCDFVQVRKYFFVCIERCNHFALERSSTVASCIRIYDSVQRHKSRRIQRRSLVHFPVSQKVFVPAFPIELIMGAIQN